MLPLPTIEDLETKRRKLLAEQLELDELELKQKRSRLERDAANAVASSQLVRLNVGGRFFDTTRDTLLRHNPDGYFKRLLDDDDEPHLRGAILDPSGRIFIDRSAESFSLLLRCLREEVDPFALSAVERANIVAEARYFQFHALEAHVDGGYNPFLLSSEDRDLRIKRQSLFARLTDDDPLVRCDARATADANYLVDIFPDAPHPPEERCAPFNSISELGSSDAGLLLFTELRDHHLRSSGPAVACTSAQDFEETLNLFAGPLFEGLDLSGLGLIVAGGAVLQSLGLGDVEDLEVQKAARSGQSDIDLFLVVGNVEDQEAAAAQGLLAYHAIKEHLASKLEECNLGRDEPTDDSTLFHALRSNPTSAERVDGLTPPLRMRSSGSLLVVRSARAVTFVAGWPQRHVQLVLRSFGSIAEVLLNFDVDCCQVAFDGTRVVATPAAARALRTRVNVVDPELGDAQSYSRRVAKYAKRGFAALVPGLHLSTVDPALTAGPFVRVDGSWDKFKSIAVRVPEAEDPRVNRWQDCASVYWGRRIRILTDSDRSLTPEVSHGPDISSKSLAGLVLMSGLLASEMRIGVGEHFLLEPRKQSRRVRLQAEDDDDDFVPSPSSKLGSEWINPPRLVKLKKVVQFASSKKVTGVALNHEFLDASQQSSQIHGDDNLYYSEVALPYSADWEMRDPVNIGEALSEFSELPMVYDLVRRADLNTPHVEDTLSMARRDATLDRHLTFPRGAFSGVRMTPEEAQEWFSSAVASSE